MRRLNRFNPVPLLALLALLAIAGGAQWLHLAVEHGHVDEAVASADENHTDHRGGHEAPERTPDNRHRHDCATCQMLALQSTIPGESITHLPIARPTCTALVPWSVEFGRDPHLNQQPARAPPLARG